MTPEGLVLLGSGFSVSTLKTATAAHVIGGDYNNIVVLQPLVNDIDDYQQTSNIGCQYVNTVIYDHNPIRDIVILQATPTWNTNPSWRTENKWLPFPRLPNLSCLDQVKVGDNLNIYGFPHCGDNRCVITYQKTNLGAKVYLKTHNIPSKHGVVNFQSRPGQSGSPVLNEQGDVVAMLIGTYVPDGGGIRFGNIDPASLNQTTHIISASYIKEML
ncbi:S1 family peptidase [Pseudomonas viridiflava]|uniref:S1 family peptidase n=1 Tax=Pseudomonas viridiflava TaxID=33069 RepID=UPI000F025FC7|nr:serine protease [Pseudomonas viridiflava]